MIDKNIVGKQNMFYLANCNLCSGHKEGDFYIFSSYNAKSVFYNFFYFSLTNHEVINLYKVICTETILCFCSFVIKLVSGTVCSVSATSLAICVANTSFFLSIHYLLFLSHNKFRIINVIKKDFM